MRVEQGALCIHVYMGGGVPVCLCANEYECSECVQVCVRVLVSVVSVRAGMAVSAWLTRCICVREVHMCISVCACACQVGINTSGYTVSLNKT